METFPPTAGQDLPGPILILGTDASGKDHVANLLVKMIGEAGVSVEKRSRLLSGSVTRERDSSDKGWWDTIQQYAFLFLFRLIGPMMPFLAAIGILWDIHRYRPPVTGYAVVVGHNSIRALALHYGHRHCQPASIRPPAVLQWAMRRVCSELGARVIVLDVRNAIRRQRIKGREAKGKVDVFDRYMLEDGHRSELIEACLVHLAVTWLDGCLIENNDLPEDELRRQLRVCLGLSA